MEPRPYWKGYLKLSLVTCPVAMSPATTESQKVRFHTINRATGNRIQSRFVDADTGKPVKEGKEAKGYETEGDRYIILEDEELDAVALESTRTIDIDVFVPRDAVPWIYLDSPNYLVPSDPVGEEAFAVIREAMATTKMVGISRLVMSRRERAVMLEPRDNGIVLWTLRYGDEVRDQKAYFAEIDADKPDAAMLDLACQIVSQGRRKWSDDLVKDPIQEHLLKLIQAKKKTLRKPAKGRAEGGARTRSNVVNIMDALRQSIAEEKAAGRPSSDDKSHANP